MIQVKGLKKSFGELQVLKGIDTEINKGECVALIGPSGTGKSVFLRSIALLEKPDDGKIFIKGIEITEKKVNINKIREKLGMVYQGYHLFSHLNVLDNITLAPRKIKKTNPADAKKKAMELLSMVGLVEKAQNFPHQLSGGQQQRIAIARCMAMEPEILLFDEPTSALDPAMTYEVLSIIKKLTKTGITMLIVTHEMSFAKEVSDRVFYMDEGIIYEHGTPANIFENPQKSKTKIFIRGLKIFRYTITSREFDLIAMNAQIELFSQKHQITSKKKYHIQLILEELILEIIKNCYQKKSPKIELSLAYSKESKALKIQIHYPSQPWNPFGEKPEGEDLDNLGILLVKNIAQTCSHEYKNDTNHIHITF